VTFQGAPNLHKRNASNLEPGWLLEAGTPATSSTPQADELHHAIVITLE
jgi:hypothetical protein